MSPISPTQSIVSENFLILTLPHILYFTDNIVEPSGPPLGSEAFTLFASNNTREPTIHNLVYKIKLSIIGNLMKIIESKTFKTL